MNPVPSQRNRASRLFNHTKSLFAALGVCLLFATSFQSQAAPLPFFSDPAMQQCLDEQVLANGWVNAEDVTVFNCMDRGVENIQGIEALVNLNELDLSDNYISDIYPLIGYFPAAGLTGLTVLRLSNNPGIDPYHAEQLVYQNPGLIRLALAGLKYPHANPTFGHFPNLFNTLIELDLSDTGINNLFEIAQYTKLQVLRLADNNLQDTYALDISALTATLKVLDLSNNNLTSITELNAYSGLTSLYVSGNNSLEFIEIEPIINQNLGLVRLGLGGIRYPYKSVPNYTHLFGQLLELDISSIGINTLVGIEQYSQLEVLRAANNNIMDIEPLGIVGPNGPLPLKVLDLSDNQLVDVAQLSQYSGLTSLHLSGNLAIEYAQVEPVINQNMELTRLGLADIVYLNPDMPYFAHLVDKLVELDFSNTGIQALNSAPYYTQLRTLSVAENNITDISPLGAPGPNYGPLPLKELDLSNNKLSSLSALNNFTKLTSLKVSENWVLGFDQVETIINNNKWLKQLGIAGVNLNYATIPSSIVNLAQSLIELDMSRTGLQNIHGIELFTQLQVLHFADNSLTDIAPLGPVTIYDPVPLKALKVLDLSNNNIADISALNGYFDLNVINLSGNSGIDYFQLEQILHNNTNLLSLGMASIKFPHPSILLIGPLLNSLIELDMSNTGLFDIAGVELYSRLRILRLANNRLTDISPLGIIGPNGPLPLAELDLSNNNISNFIDLSHITGLTSFHVSGNLGIDYMQIEPIINQNIGLRRLGLAGVIYPYPMIPSYPHLTNKLIELDFSNTGIEDIFNISPFRNLKTLNLSDNNIADIGVLGGGWFSESLREIDLSNNKLVNIDALINMTGLTSLYLSGNKDIAASQIGQIVEQNTGITRLGLADINYNTIGFPIDLYRLSNQLIELDLSNAGIENIGQLYGIEQLKILEILKLADNKIQDISLLSQLAGTINYSQNLIVLDLSSNNITDISALSGFNKLTELKLSGNVGIDYIQLDPIINQNMGLERLGLADININSMSIPLSITNLSQSLIELDLNNTGIQNIFGIELFQILEILKLADNQIQDISPLAQLAMSAGPLLLQQLDLSNNNITDVSALQYYDSLTELNLSGNGAIDYFQLRPVIDVNIGLTKLGLADIQMGNPGAPFPVYWHLLDKLVELDISNTGLDFIGGVEQYSQLRILRMANNNLTDIYPLSSPSLQLEYIDLTGNNKIQCDQLDQLSMWLPNATVIRPTSCMIGYAPDLFISHPFDGFTVIEGQLFDLVANSFDPENGDLSAQIQWSIDDKPSSLIGSVIHLRIFEPGTHTITASITDLDNNTVSQSIQITVIPNTAPSLIINSPYIGQSVLEGELLHLSATASDLEDGILDNVIHWNSSIDGSLGVGGILAVNLSVGDHVITATVTDAFHKSTSQTVNVTVVFNNPPVVTITSPVSGTSSLEGVSTNLVASAIDNEDGSLATINWQSNLQGDLGTGVNMNVNLVVGVHTITATAVDSLGKTGTQTVSYEVVFNNPPSLTISSPVNGSSLIEGESSTLSASAIDTEQGDLSASISWSSDIQGVLGTGSTVSTILGVGTHAISATITDAQGKTTTQTVSHTVVFNNPPVVTISNPVNNSSIIEGTSINLVASVLDTEDGDLSATTSWSSDLTGYLGTGSQLPVTLPVGVHTITATVTDSHGKTSSQSSVLTVVFNNPPVLTLATGIDGTSTEDGLNVQLSATAVDAESGDLGSIIAWNSDISGSLGVGSNLSVMLPIGVHTLTATVIDPHGKSQTVTAQHTVVIAPMLSYCDGYSTDAKKEWIESIFISGVTNTSGSQMGYGDFWDNGPIYLNRSSNTITLTPGYAVNVRNEYWQIWIDTNRDGVFADSEAVVSVWGAGELTQNFTLPADAITGNTRMRIVLKSKDPSFACGSYKHGEVEDYRVIIQP